MEKIKKIGIVTFCNSKDNYGQILQCYALQEFLRKHGFEPFLIRVKSSGSANAASEESNKAKSWLRYVVHLKSYIALYQKQRRYKKYCLTAENEKRRFGDFVEKHIVATPTVYDEHALKLNPPKADAYICGSDQIWGGSFCYYLDFAPEGSIRIAYAASFGGVNQFNAEYEKQVSHLLNKFSFVGCREKSGVNTCGRLGRKDAVQVVDPTLLLDTIDYGKIESISKKYSGKKYVLLYLLGNPTNLDVKTVYAYARKKACDVVYVASQGQYDNKGKEWASIEEWIGLIKHAELVVTNSFHGTVFSLIHHTPFVTVPLAKAYSRMNVRVVELLEKCNMTNRLWHSSIFKEKNLEEMDFSAFDSYCIEEVKASKNILLNQLELSNVWK